MNQEELNMVYNSQRSDLVMPEYGRSFQKLVQHCVTIEDPKTRQGFAERLIKLMMQMQPNYKNTNDHVEKLWNQMFMVAEYKLDVEVPEGITITEHKDRPKPNRLEYPSADKRFRHYGNHVQTLVNKALKMEDDPKRETFVNVIGSYMKLAYRTWSRDHYVNDEIIINDLNKISKGKLNLKEDLQLSYLNETLSLARSNSNNVVRKKRSGSSGGSSRKQSNHKKRRK